MRIFSTSASFCMSLSLLCSSASLISSDFENWDPQYYHNGFSPDDKLAEDDKLAAQARECEKQHANSNFKLASLRLDLQSLGTSHPEIRKVLRKKIQEEYAIEHAKQQARGQKKKSASTPLGANGRTAPAQPIQAVASRLAVQTLLIPVIYVPCNPVLFMPPSPRAGIECCSQGSGWRMNFDCPSNKHQRFISQQPAAMQDSLFQARGAVEEQFEHNAYFAQVRRAWEQARMQHQRNF